LVRQFQLFEVRLDFDEDRGESVHEANEMGSFLAVVAGNPELEREEVVTSSRIGPSNSRTFSNGFFNILMFQPAMYDIFTCRFSICTHPDSLGRTHRAAVITIREWQTPRVR